MRQWHKRTALKCETRLIAVLVGAHRKSETFMRTIELFRTCANEHVAAAALACIGGKLQKRVAAAAQSAGLPPGGL